MSDKVIAKMRINITMVYQCDIDIYEGVQLSIDEMKQRAESAAKERLVVNYGHATAALTVITKSFLMPKE